MENGWLTLKELSNIILVDYDAVRMAVKRGKYTQVKYEKNTIGKPTPMVHINDPKIPFEARQKWLQNSDLASIRKCDDSDMVPASKSVIRISKNSLATQARKKTADEIPDRYKKLALSKYNLVKLYVASIDGFGYSNKSEVQNKFLTSYNSGSAYPELFKNVGPVAFKTIEKWKKRIQETQDPYVLCNQYFTVKRSCKVTTEQSTFLIKYLFNPNQLFVNEVIRLAREEMDSKGIVHESVSNSTMRRFCMKVIRERHDIWTLATKGESGLMRILPHVTRDNSKILLGDVVVADGHTLNFESINPATGKPKRMTLIMLIDMKTSFPLGWFLMATENTQSIAAAYRMAIQVLGFIPRVFYLDNGRAFKAKFFTGSPDFIQSGFTGKFEMLGSLVMNARAYHGQSKTIERFFGTMGEMERTQPTYTGTSISLQPPRMSRGEKTHRKIYDQAVGSYIPSYEETMYIIRIWMDKYINRPQQDGFLKGVTPKEAFDIDLEKVKDQEDFLSRIPTADKLDDLMMYEEIQTLYPNGLKVKGVFYWSDAFSRLIRGTKHNFIVKYDVMDLTRIKVYDDHGFFCEATPIEYAHPMAKYLGTKAESDQFTRLITHKNDIEKSVKQDYKDVMKELDPVAAFMPRLIMPTADNQLNEDSEVPAKKLPKVNTEDVLNELDEILNELRNKN